MIYDDTDDGMTSISDWILLTDDAKSLEAPQISEVAMPVELRPDLKLWTDDFNNIVQVLK